MKVVKVYGALKKRLGKGTFKLDVKTPAEAIKALCTNFPWLADWLTESKDKGVSYKVLLGKKQIVEENIDSLLLPWSEKDVFKITPVVTGAGGLGRTLLGVGLIAFGFMTGGLGFTFAGGISGWAGAAWYAKAMVGFGAMLTLSGVSQMLAPIPEMPSTSPEANLIQNYSFSGIQNTTHQGFPVPICYGRCFAGSAIVSAALDVV